MVSAEQREQGAAEVLDELGDAVSSSDAAAIAECVNAGSFWLVHRDGFTSAPLSSQSSYISLYLVFVFLWII